MQLIDFPVKTILIENKDYPEALRLIPNPPKCLYAKGNLRSTQFETCLGIVGSRRVSSYGIAVLSRLFETLAAGKLTTVSGFMRGVDVYAHSLSIERGIPTIAVLPCGIEEIYPTSQQNLYDAILKNGGLVLSEYPRKEKPRDWMFVKRNRIVAGLSSCLLVVEAGRNSGSLVTYEYAKRYGKKILTVPCDIFREGGLGICHILRDGARPVFSGADINEELGIKSQESVGSQLSLLTGEESKVFSLLVGGPADLNTLAKLAGMPISILSTFVTKLQLSGFIKELGGLFYAVKS